MRLHRFYLAPDQAELKESIWLQSPSLRNQWLKVFRYRVGDEVVLFDGIATDRLYKIAEIADDAIHVQMVTEFERKLPKRHIYLFWSLLKKDKNEWVVQKCTELGVTNFVPLVAERSEKTGFNLERAEKIAIEAAEQCGRSDIPHIREPLRLEQALNEYGEKLKIIYAEETAVANGLPAYSDEPVGVFIGPEGGWTQEEIAQFTGRGSIGMKMGDLTLRAETAAVASITKVMHMDS